MEKVIFWMFYIVMGSVVSFLIVFSIMLVSFAVNLEHHVSQQVSDIIFSIIVMVSLLTGFKLSWTGTKKYFKWVDEQESERYGND